MSECTTKLKLLVESQLFQLAFLSRLRELGLGARLTCSYSPIDAERVLPAADVRHASVIGFVGQVEDIHVVDAASPELQRNKDDRAYFTYLAKHPEANECAFHLFPHPVVVEDRV